MRGRLSPAWRKWSARTPYVKMRLGSFGLVLFSIYVNGRLGLVSLPGVAVGKAAVSHS